MACVLNAMRWDCALGETFADCPMIEQPTQHPGLNNPGTSCRLRHVDGSDASVGTREGHDAIHAAPDARRTP